MNSQHRPIPPHLIEAAWEQYEHFMLQTGAPPPNKLHFLGGFAACIGLLVGTIDAGIPQETPTRDVMAQLVNIEIPRYQKEINELVEREKRKTQ